MENRAAGQWKYMGKIMKKYVFLVNRKKCRGKWGNIFGKNLEDVGKTSGKKSGKSWEMSGNRFKHSVGKPV